MALGRCKPGKTEQALPAAASRGPAHAPPGNLLYKSCVSPVAQATAAELATLARPCARWRGSAHERNEGGPGAPPSTKGVATAAHCSSAAGPASAAASAIAALRGPVATPTPAPLEGSAWPGGATMMGRIGPTGRCGVGRGVGVTLTLMKLVSSRGPVMVALALAP